jgi:hypothetical protein
MKTNRVYVSTAGYSVSYSVTIILGSVFILINNSHVPYKDRMNSHLDYHWMTQGFFMMLFFLVLGFCLSQIEIEKKLSSRISSAFIIVSTLLGCILIMLTNATY